MTPTVKKNTKLLIPPHLARPYLDDLQKVDQNTYFAKKDIDIKISNEICILALPAAFKGNSDQHDNEELSQADLIKDAVFNMDAQNDDLWTADGKPQVNAVRDVLNDISLTRKQIDQALDGFSRKDLLKN